MLIIAPDRKCNSIRQDYQEADELKICFGAPMQAQESSHEADINPEMKKKLNELGFLFHPHRFDDLALITTVYHLFL